MVSSPFWLRQEPSWAGFAFLRSVEKAKSYQYNAWVRKPIQVDAALAGIVYPMMAGQPKRSG